LHAISTTSRPEVRRSSPQYSLASVTVHRHVMFAHILDCLLVFKIPFLFRFTFCITVALYFLRSCTLISKLVLLAYGFFTCLINRPEMMRVHSVEKGLACRYMDGC
jgi:hypothetical protein